MTITLSGIVHGRRIDLETEAPIPDGAPVTVRLEPKRLTIDERRQIVIATAGSWRDDVSLDAVFAELDRGRRDTVPRQSSGE